MKPGTEAAFLEATLQNARASPQEPGVARFDVLQDTTDPTQFVLVEVYRDTVEAPAAHKETAHYMTWRDQVADYMATERTRRTFTNVFPRTTVAWEYPQEEGLLE